MPSWISSRILCQSPEHQKKGDTMSKKRTFLNRDRSGEGDGGRIISRIWTHTHTHGPERCTPHLLRYFCCSRTSIGDVRTTKRLVVNTRVKYCKGARTAFFFPKRRRRRVRAHIPHEKWHRLSRKQCATQRLMCVQQKN